VVKRAFDVLVSLALMPVALPVMALAAAALALELRANPVFVQERVGKGGRTFRMYKLRTMRPAATPAAIHRIENWDEYYFSPPGVRDPRVSRIGAFVRKTSIDELPQLFNVLKGEMSLVGPRPEIPEIVAQYPAHFHERHRVLPGIAGLAQVSGRSDLTYSETVALDLCYIDSQSLWRDIAILARTAWVVLRGVGAR